jgi:aminopeptidase N
LVNILYRIAKHFSIFAKIIESIMKKTYLFALVLLNSLVFAQNKRDERIRLAESEMKSAASTFEIQVNPNTLNYDISYHRLDLTINPSVKFITGKITTTYTALANMNTITFDFANSLTTSSVKMGTTNLTFVENSSNELVITLPSTQQQGTTATIEVNYSGVPPVNGFDSFVQTTHSGTPIIWTLSEPFGARDWWPCKQDLNDKIDSIDVYITAPSQYTSVANGIETTPPVINGSNKTTHFHHNYPIPAYLIAIACTNYTVYNQTAGIAPDTFPVVNYLYPENASTSQSLLSVTPDIMNFFSTQFEPYPFKNEKYGHAQFSWGGGMEHTTVSFMQNFSRGLIAHELAHQWFGDKITCGTWKDIWLNEGFATYLAALVIEEFDGEEAFINEKSDMIDYITSLPNGNVYLTDTQATNVNRIFNSRLSYDKGAMILEMLRFKMGDTAFFQALRNYLADTNLAYNYAVTTDLIGHLEVVYGSDLDGFFDDWVYKQGYPIYDITVANIGNGQALFTINQTQSDPNNSVDYFEMPVPVRVYGANGQQMDVVLENTMDGETFIRNIPFTITSAAFDPEKHIISFGSSSTLSNSAFELENAISVVPNPASNEVSIQMPSAIAVESISIYNGLGQLIATKNSADFSISDLSNGVLFLKIQTSEGTFHKKMIKN